MGTRRSATPSDVPDGPDNVCSAIFRPAELMFLLHAACQRMSDELDQAAVAIGLKDTRDWLVLAVLADGEQRTQLEVSRVVCVDKTTLISVLDRLEERNLIVRAVDPNDRRVRIPQITAAGRRVFAKFATARDAAEARVLEGVESGQREILLTLLARIADQNAIAVTPRAVVAV